MNLMRLRTTSGSARAALSFASCLLVQGAAWAQSPIAPGQPASVHTYTACNDTSSYGNNASSCASSQVSEDPALDHVAGLTTASADLATGQLRLREQNQSLGVVTGELDTASFARTTFYDTLTVVGPISGTMPVVMHMTVDGSFATTDLTPSFNNDYLTMILSDNDHFLTFAEADIAIGNNGVPGITGSGYVANVLPGTNRLDPADMRIELTLSFQVSQASPSFTFLAALTGQSGNDHGAPLGVTTTSTLDFGHTAQLSLDLPAGYSFTSASGAFLTGAVAPVPEPDTAWLLAAGLLPIVGRLMARRSARA